MNGVVVVAATADVHTALPEGASLLTPLERRRAAAFRRAGDRDDFVAAHLLARLCAHAALGTPLDVPVVQHCGRCGGDHGVPHLPSRADGHLSWSHAYGAVAAAADNQPVGVDVEPLSQAAAAAEALAVIASPEEARALQTGSCSDEDALRLWVRKEALIKLGLFDLDHAGASEVWSTAPCGIVASVSGPSYALLDVRTRVGEMEVLAASASVGKLSLTTLAEIISFTI